MSYNRTTGTLRGAAVLEFTGGTILRSAGDIKTRIGVSTFDVPSSETRRVDQRLTSIDIELTFQPVGEVTAAQVALLFALLAKTRGQSILGATDVTCAIKPKAGGEAITISSIFVSKPPAITIKSTGTSIGEVTLRGILPLNTDWSAATARFTYTAALAAPTLSAIDASLIPTSAARLTWGAASPWLAIKTGEGVTVDWDVATIDDVVDEDGLVDVWLDRLTPKIKVTSPRGLTVKNLLDRMLLQGTGAGRGKSIAGTAVDLTVEGADPGSLKVVVPKVILKNLPLSQGIVTRWLGDLDLEGTEEDAASATVSIVPEA